MIAFLLSPLGRWIGGAVLVVALCAGIWFHGRSAGHDSASQKYEQAMAEERARQQRIADEALAEANKRALELIRRNHDLQMKLKDLANEADDDPDADRPAISPDGVLRLNRIR